MTDELLTEHHLEFLSLKEAAEARPSLQMSKCQIVGNLMHWLYLDMVISALKPYRLYVLYECKKLTSWKNLIGIHLYENSNQNPPELQVDYRRNWHGISIFQLELTRRWNTCKNPGGITERFQVDFSDSSWKLSSTWNFFLRIYPPGMFPNSI